MDVISVGIDKAFPIQKKIHWVFLITVYSTVLGCSWPQPKTVNPAPSASIDQLAKTAAQIRGLTFKRPVALTDQPANTKGTGADMYGTQLTTQLSRVYKRLGLLAGDVDLGHGLSEFSRLQRVASYDAERRAIFLAPESARIGQALADGAPLDASSIPAMIALTHALQEQHFHWQERINGLTLEDRKLAFRALADGDAIRVALSFVQANHSAATWADHVQAIGRLTTELERAASSLPTMLREKLVFPYRDGTQFVEWAYAAKGWAGVNALFADPPVSSAQILHPEQYFLRRAVPVQIIPFGLFRQTKGNAVTEQTLGEFLIQVLLASSHSRKDAALIASSWTGDYLSAYPDGENLIIAWLSAWTDDVGAQRFYRAFQYVLEHRHGLRFEASARQQDGLKADLRTGRSVILQVRGPVVLLLDGMTAPRALETSDAIWKELEIRTESPSIPFETAKGPTHSSLMSR